MKNGLFILIMGLMLTSIGCEKDDIEEIVPPPPAEPTLTAQEESDLIFLREEEKLARDVYLFSLDKYEEQIFQNISNSEQKHMDKLLDLLNFYNIEDPAQEEIGVFTNEELQVLYDELVMISDSSLVHAFTVGAIIEDLDIKDIVHFEENTDKVDILEAYANLVCGSKNHIQGYTNKLNANGVTYVPQFISQEDYDTILDEGHLNCN